MSKHRSSSPPDVHPLQMNQDLRALGEATTREVPSLAQVVAAVRAPRSGRARKPFASLFTLRLLAPGAVAVGLLMLLVPVSYERTVGHDVILAVTAADGQPRADLIADPMRSVLGAATIPATATGRSHEIELHAYVPVATVRDPAARVRTLAKALAERGYMVRTSFAPRRRRVSGSVYAYARNQWFRVKSEGKTPAEIEAELRRKLDEAGLVKTTVSVAGDDHRRQVRIESNGAGTSTPGGSIGIELGTGERSPGGASIATSRIATLHDGVILHAEVTAHGKTAAVDVPHSESLSDAALAAEVESRLARAGVHVRVLAKDGSLQVQAR